MLLEEQRINSLKDKNDKSDYARILQQQQQDRLNAERMEKEKDKAFALSEAN